VCSLGAVYKETKNNKHGHMEAMRRDILQPIFIHSLAQLPSKARAHCRNYSAFNFGQEMFPPPPTGSQIANSSGSPPAAHLNYMANRGNFLFD